MIHSFFCDHLLCIQCTHTSQFANSRTSITLEINYIGLGPGTLPTQSKPQGPSGQHPQPFPQRRRQMAVQFFRRRHCPRLGYDHLQMLIPYPFEPGCRRYLFCRLLSLTQYYVHWLPKHQHPGKYLCSIAHEKNVVQLVC